MNIQYSFPNRHIVITGGARGIGFELSKLFLQSGAHVAIWDYSREGLDVAKRELAQFGERVHIAQVDVSKFASVEAATKALPFAPDTVVNNAGITRDKSFSKMNPEDWQAVIDTNLTGVFNVTKSLLPVFKTDQTPKRIINISSVVALYGNFGQTNYVAAKAGVIGMTKTWARELSRKGFAVNAVAPGFTLTPMVEAMPEEARKQIEQKIPAGRFGQPRDIANAVMFLAAEESGYISGTVISVDGALVI